MSYSKPDLTIQGVLIRRMYSDVGTVNYYLLRYKRPDGGWQDRLVDAPLIPLTSRHQPIPTKLDDQAEIAYLTRVINGEEDL